MNDRNRWENLSSGLRDDRLQAADDRLKLPRGAFIALRQSGGLRFSTREVIVYNDGRVISRRQGKLGAGEGSRRITPAEVAELKETDRAERPVGTTPLRSGGRVPTVMPTN